MNKSKDATSPQYRYTEIPIEISQIIFGDDNPHAGLNIGKINLFDVLTKIVCSAEEKTKTFGISAAEAYDFCIDDFYWYMKGHWIEKPAEITKRGMYIDIRDLLLGKPGNVCPAVVLYAADYFKGNHEEKSINKEFLSTLINQLKVAEEHEIEVMSKTEEINKIINHICWNFEMVDKVNLFAERLKIEGNKSSVINDMSFFWYGYIEGKRNERSRKSKTEVKAV